MFKSWNGEQGTGNEERGTRNEERGSQNGDRGSHGDPRTGIGERGKQTETETVVVYNCENKTKMYLICGGDVGETWGL